MEETTTDTVEAIARCVRPRAGGGSSVDMLVLEDAPLWLQFRVVAGRPLFSRDEHERIAFRERVEKEFLDFRYYHDSYLAAVRERARRGVLSRS